MPRTTAITPALPSDPEGLVVPPRLAAYLDTSEAVLAQLRYLGRGIPYIKNGRRIFYRVKDIREYLDRNTTRPEED